MNKKGIELAVNFIVLTVLSLIVLGIGFYLVTSIFTTATEYKEKLDEQTKENILSTLKQSGDLISLPITQYSIERGNYEVIPLGLLNTLDASETFFVSADCTEAQADDNTELCSENAGISCDAETTGFCSNWIIVDPEETTLEAKDSDAIGLFVTVPDTAPSGIFGYKIQVCTGALCGSSGSTAYGPTKKLYITVPE